MPDGFGLAAGLLPMDMRKALMALEPRHRERAEEIRLRAGQEPTLLLPEGERVFRPGRAVESGEMAFVLDRASASSLHAVQDELKRGFITASGGVRVGVCGRAVMGQGVEGIRDVSSLALRIPRQVKGAGGEIIDALLPDPGSVLILSPPGGGKTTFLRELIRRFSDSGLRVSVCDERGEIAAVQGGKPMFELGRSTDVLTGAEKAAGIMMLLRAMNPQVIAIDEISAAKDIAAVLSAANCGAEIFATAHADGVEALSRRSVYRPLLESGVFQRAVVISGKGRRKYEVVEL